MIKKVFLGTTLLLILPAVAFGAALEGPGLGARALSMGGAFIGLADDWTATYWNPAGLAQLKEPGAGVTLDIAFARTTDGNSVANPTLGEVLGDRRNDQQNLFFRTAPGEPARFNKTGGSNIAYLPGLGFHTPVAGNATLGGSVYNPIGHSSRWHDQVGNASANFETGLSLTVFNVSLAKEVVSKVFLGAGINLLHGEYELTAHKTVSGTSGYDFDYDMNISGNSFEGIVGILYKPLEKFSVGGVYRSGSQMTLEGEAKARHSTLSALINGESDVERVFNHPTTYGAGMAFKPSSFLTLTADWSRTDWGEMRREIVYQKPGGLLQNKNNSLEWKETDRFRVGSELKPFENGTVMRMGYYYEPSPVPGKAVSMSNVIEVDKNVVAGGVGYEVKNWQANFTYLHAWGKETINNIFYKKVVNSFQVAVSCLF